MTNPATSRVQVGELEFAYESFGSPDDPTVLLVMGLATQMLGWPEPFCELLADAGYHVVRFDNRDIGLSTHLHEAGTPNLAAFFAGKPAPPPYSVEDMAGDAIGLLDALDVDTAHVVGISLGGMIAQAAAIRHPRRVRSLTSIMSTPAAHIGKPTPQAQAALLLPPAKTRDEAGERAVEAYRIIGSPAYPLDEARVNDVARRSFDRAADPAGVARQLAAVLAAGDRTPALRDVRVPTLVIHGADDPLIQVAGGHATAAAVPNSELLVFPGMGHDLPAPLWRPIIDAIAALMDKADAG